MPHVGSIPGHLIWRRVLWNACIIIALILITLFLWIERFRDVDDFRFRESFPSSIHAGEGSVYVPGAGFAGFWYHFGFFTYQQSLTTDLLQQNKDIDHRIHHNQTYYCYSSGCLGYILAMASVPVDTVLNAAEQVQQQWLSGHVHRYEVVPNFLSEVLPSDIITACNNQTLTATSTSLCNAKTLSSTTWDTILSQIRILVTVMESKSIFNNPILRHRVHVPSSYTTLIRYLQETTHIPWLTGPFIQHDSDEVVIDGGFSRLSHPVCDTHISVPNTWSTLIHSLNPGLDPKQAQQLFHQGMTNAASTFSIPHVEMMQHHFQI